MARVFSAITIEDERILNELEKVQSKLDSVFNKVSRDKMHITLEFFHDIDNEGVQKLKNAMDNVEKDSFELPLNSIGVFPSEEYIRVVWIGTDSDDIHELHRQTSNHEVENGHSHEFVPHVTLLRTKDLSEEKRDSLLENIRIFEDCDFGEIKVDKITLFESEINSDGTLYRKLHEKRL